MAVSTREIFNFEPFYNDFHALIYVEGGENSKLILHPEAVKRVLETMNIIRIIQKKEYILSHTHKVNLSIMELNNGYFTAIIRKDYIWDYFSSTGVIVIISQNFNTLSAFLQTKLGNFFNGF